MKAQHFIELLHKRSGVSMNKFSSILGYKSPAHVCLLIQGKRKLSVRAANRVIKYAKQFGINLRLEMIMDE